MELRVIMKALDQARKTHEEQQAFWDTFEELWPTEESTPYSLSDDVDQLQINKIQQALENSDGNKTHAAKALGIKRETLLAKIKRYSSSLNFHKS
jgi:two-component system, NtrC family, response regulator AtoC